MLRHLSAAAVLLVTVEAELFAQERRWEFEAHIGGVTGTSGSAAAPHELTQPDPRFVSSWYFGDGAKLLNQVNGLLGASGRMAPLDLALTSGITRQGASPAIGARVVRWLTARVGLEGSLDYSRSAVTMNDTALAAVQAAQSGFADAWDTFFDRTRLAADGTITTVRSEADAKPGSGHQLLTVAALRFIVHENRQLRAFVSGGAGLAFRAGSLPEVAFRGLYQFTTTDSGVLLQFTETDSVRMHVEVDNRHVPVGVVHGGVQYELGPYRGLDVDVALYVSPMSVRTLLDAAPRVTVREPAGVASSKTSPALVFSNGTGTRSSLSGGDMTNVVAADVSSLLKQVRLSVGYFWRF